MSYNDRILLVSCLINPLIYGAMLVFFTLSIKETKKVGKILFYRPVFISINVSFLYLIKGIILYEINNDFLISRSSIIYALFSLLLGIIAGLSNLRVKE